jgi:hypothetical protein
MKEQFIPIALFSIFAALACPAHAQQVGEACTGSTTNIATVRSTIETQGILQCIPNSNGDFFWQPMGAGTVLYDNSATCSIAGELRWNGTSIQYCDGSTWKSFGGGGLGNLHGGGESFYCDPGYNIVGFQFNCGCTNNAIWFECQPQ